jgi:hypothetical protein
MENLFYKQDITQTYDLKGIGVSVSRQLGIAETGPVEGRKVPKTSTISSRHFSTANGWKGNSEVASSSIHVGHSSNPSHHR